MERVGFGYKWMRWMSVLINGCPTKEFKISRGLRQGDPLSPFLFNIAAEGLSYMFQRAAEANMLRGEDFSDNGTHVTHLQFADDTVLFIKPETKFLYNSKRILRCFELISGL
ncbi:hypothetical protein Dsin_022507 [Dipteronia sinensis]|uniref:Reverse transcriptase domain-containing protein n=1 Tax=Dipteronia sinensis TaxID=43782 RepID=A0AAE0E179_9ROSI|nr:hypothetical protein Dsin_022507 [Dipteronia sinensis]